MLTLSLAAIFAMPFLPLPMMPILRHADIILLAIIAH
jgi:hypothetical protein